MASKGRRRMWWIVFALIVIAAGAGLSLQYAISRNGAAVLDVIDRLTGGSRDVELAQKVSLGDAEAQKLAVYRLQDGVEKTPAGGRPVLVFVHGGSWRNGNPDDYGFFARAFVPKGFVVVLAGYRLGKSGVFPAMVEDTASAVAWTHANISRFGGNPDQIFLAGHSAGAYNVAMVGLDRQWLGRAGLPDDTVKGVIGMAGPYDFYPFDSDSTREAFGGAHDPQKTQPVNFVRKDAPPMLLLTGQADTVVKPRNTKALSAAIEKVGGRVETGYFPGFDHNRILLATASPWRHDPEVMDRISRFVTAQAAKIAVKTSTSVPVQDKTL